MARKGLFSKLIEGTEKSEGEARAGLPSSRFSLFWQVFKGNFLKLVGLNLFVLIFFAPVIFFFLNSRGMLASSAALQPFSQNLVTGYPIVPIMKGVDVAITNSANYSFFVLLPIMMIVAAVGLSGVLYVVRNMVWTEGIFISSDLWKGIKKNYFITLFNLFTYALFFSGSNIALGQINYYLAIGYGTAWLFWAAKIAIYLFMVIVSIIFLYMLTMGVTYNLKPHKLLRNGFIMTLGLFLPNLVFFALTVLPLFLLFMLPSSALSIIIALFLFIGASYMILVWTTYSHWVYDRTMNPNIPGAKVGRGIYDKVDSHEGEAKALALYKLQLKEMKNDRLITTPIKPIDDDIVIEELPVNFKREDLLKLAGQKQIMKEDAEKWADEHRDDDKYTVFKEMEEEERLEAEAEEEKRKKYLEKEKNKKKK